MGTMNKQEFERQARVVSSAWNALDEDQEWQPIFDHYNLGFPFAHLVVAKMGTLNADGKQMVTDTYAFILKAMGVEDSTEYESFWDVINARTKAGV